MAKKAAATAAAVSAPNTVKVEALENHTCLGGSYTCGQTYAAPADLVDSLETQGKAIRVEGEPLSGSHAARVRGSAVEPMGITSKAKPTKAKTGTYKRKDLRAKR